MDVINPEQVRDFTLPLVNLNRVFLFSRLVLLRKLVHVLSWPLREFQPTFEQKV